MLQFQESNNNQKRKKNHSSGFIQNDLKEISDCYNTKHQRYLFIFLAKYQLVTSCMNNKCFKAQTELKPIWYWIKPFSNCANKYIQVDNYEMRSL